MKTVFIINPCAGRGGKAEVLSSQIRSILLEDYDVYITKAIGDATRFVKNYCEEFGAARFIACGGDGTFNEVLNGVADCPGAEVGVIPIGTGNDFCRNFKVTFDDILGQIHGKTVKCDAIRYTTETDEGTVTGYCANMFNIGFDCNVADLTTKIKSYPFVSGSMAYLLSIFVNLICKKGANLRIEIDGEKKHFGKLLLTSVANGCYCGGGIMSNPLASICDGTININIIKNVSRMRFIGLLPSYIKGTFLGKKNIDRIVQSTNCREIEISPIAGKMRLCIDGEIVDAGKTRFKICPGVFNFVVPNSQTRNETQIAAHV